MIKIFLNVPLYPCIPVSLYPCIPIFLYHCIPVSLYPCIPVSLYPCIPISLYPCIHVSLYPYISVSMYHCIPISLRIPVCIRTRTDPRAGVRLEKEEDWRILEVWISSRKPSQLDTYPTVSVLDSNYCYLPFLWNGNRKTEKKVVFISELYYFPALKLSYCILGWNYKLLR